MANQTALWKTILLVGMPYFALAQESRPAEPLKIPEPIPAIRLAPEKRVAWVGTPLPRPAVKPLLEAAARLNRTKLRALSSQSWEEQILSAGKEIFARMRVNLGPVAGVETLPRPAATFLLRSGNLLAGPQRESQAQCGSRIHPPRLLPSSRLHR